MWIHSHQRQADILLELYMMHDGYTHTHTDIYIYIYTYIYTDMYISLTPPPPCIAAEAAGYTSRHLFLLFLHNIVKENTETNSHTQPYNSTHILSQCRIHLILVDCAVAICVKQVESSLEFFEREHAICHILTSQYDSASSNSQK